MAEKPRRRRWVVAGILRRNNRGAAAGCRDAGRNRRAGRQSPAVSAPRTEPRRPAAVGVSRRGVFVRAAQSARRLFARPQLSSVRRPSGIRTLDTRGIRHPGRRSRPGVFRRKVHAAVNRAAADPHRGVPHHLLFVNRRRVSPYPEQEHPALARRRHGVDPQPSRL